MVLNTEWAQVEIIDLINDGSGLAFGIIGGRSTGVVVKTIVPGGVADRDGRLQSGDHILQIGEVNLRGLGSEQVASVLRQCGVHVRMVVARPIESTSADYQTMVSNAPVVPTKILGDPVELDRHLIENGYGDMFASQYSNTYNTPYIFTGQQTDDIQLHSIPRLVDTRNSIAVTSVSTITSNKVKSTTLLPFDVDLLSATLPETEMYEVELCKDDLGLGITVAGYVCEKEELSGIFVKSISKGSAADVNGQIKINDRIIEVDGKSVVGHTNHQAVEMLRNTGPIVTISFERYLRGPKYEQLQQAIRAHELKPPSPPSPSLTSLPKISLSQMTSTLDADVESRTSVDFDSAILVDRTPTNENHKEIVIGGQKLLQFSIMSHESVYEKWKGMLKDDVEIVILEMTKDDQSGLGISLEGTVDVEDGQEVRPHHYIRNILPNGPVGRNSVLQSGDELLEVNGIQLLGMNHVDVVSILKQLPSFVMLVCARYSVPTRIINTAQCRDAFQARNILAGSLQTLIPNGETLVKAKSDTSIASSVVSETCFSDLGSRSRSLEMITGLPMWNDSYLTVELVKSDYGLGFSILDYQDPLNSEQTVIVIRSLIPGGVAQSDGRLIPGDRLVAVNDIDVEHATLDRAVQVIKAAPKGIVKITVAKPISSNDNISHHSQCIRKIILGWMNDIKNISLDTDQEDQTCLDEFQECIEEYRECLEVVQICIEDDNSFNHSSCTSQLEDLRLNDSENDSENITNDTSYLNVDNEKNASESELSFNSTCDKSEIIGDLCAIENDLNAKIQNINSIIALPDEKLIQFLRNGGGEEVSERDGYETCVDESFSDETFAKIVSHASENGERTPTNSNANLGESVANHVTLRANSVSSEPCLNMDRCNFTKNIRLDTKLDDLNSYDQRTFGGDEFFLVQYSKDDLRSDGLKCCSEPNVDTQEKPLTKYKRCIEEYYNDYEDCLESYRQYVQSECLKETVGEEMDDDDIFCDILLPFKSRSAPDILDNSFVTLTYDPGPDFTRRKSALVCGYTNFNGDSMTVTRAPQSGFTAPKETPTSNMLQKQWGPIRTVRIERPSNTSLGISIVGGKVDLHASKTSPKTVLGIFVKHVVPNSPAGRTGELNTGDRILEVSGVDLRESSHERAVEAIRNATNPVTFLIQSIIQWNDDGNESRENHYSSSTTSPNRIGPPEEFRTEQENYQKATNETSNDEYADGSANKATKCEASTIKNDEETSDKKSDLHNDVSQADEKKHVESSEESDDEEDVRELEGRTVSAKGEEIDRASAANVKRTKEEIAADPEEEDDFGYTMNKVKKKYSNLGHTILMVQLERGGQGLGLSLAGHKDRNCMAVFVCGINPTGAAYKTGGIQVGDEILEVNGVVLHGRCHLNASAIIKSLSGPIFKVIILRRKAAIDDIAVRPITQFPVSLAEEASEEYFSTYPNVRTITVRKGPQGLGIMIIEGKHTDVGQGIFISDLQEGSVAEKAGLEIGEMILAVNKEPLLGSNYDNAATLLKRTEGLVTLIVSNPTKKSSTPENELSANDVGPPGSSNAVANSIGGQISVGGKPNLKTGAPASRPTTPVPEPPADPLTCPITAGKDTTLELNSDNKLLGLFFTGGKDTLVPEGAIIIEVYPGGACEKDGRLQPGDQIIEVNGTILKDATYTTASQALRQTLPKMKLNVYRPEKIDFQVIDVELVKKPGKGLGVSIIARKSGKGVYVSEILNGGSADIDGKMTKGDLLISVNGQSVENASGEEAGAILKTVVGKVTLKLHRYKATSR